jgi:hypothetical protein
VAPKIDTPIGCCSQFVQGYTGVDALQKAIKAYCRGQWIKQRAQSGGLSVRRQAACSMIRDGPGAGPRVDSSRHAAD